MIIVIIIIFCGLIFIDNSLVFFFSYFPITMLLFDPANALDSTNMLGASRAIPTENENAQFAYIPFMCCAKDVCYMASRMKNDTSYSAIEKKKLRTVFYSLNRVQFMNLSILCIVP